MVALPRTSVSALQAGTQNLTMSAPANHTIGDLGGQLFVKSPTAQLPVIANRATSMAHLINARLDAYDFPAYVWKRPAHGSLVAAHYNEFAGIKQGTI